MTRSVTLLFFAQCADWMRCRELRVPLPEPARIQDLMESLPALAPLKNYQGLLRVAVNREFAGFEDRVREGDEIAFLPPVSGG
jgi:sulfur-carrier protein